uniref:Uncharacterized protein n=1 Tax=Acrobeloides nanus TaxID=290746 RepID=A0A914E706_9BILA
MPKPQEPEISYSVDVPDEIFKVIEKNLRRPNQATKSDKNLKYIEKPKKNKQIRKGPPFQLLLESVPKTIKPQEEQVQIEKIFAPNLQIKMPRIIIRKLSNTLQMNPKKQAVPVQQVSQNINNVQLEQVQKPIQLPQAYEQVPQRSEPVVQQQVPEPRQSTQENYQQPFGCQEGSIQQAVSLQPNRPCYGVANQEFGHSSPPLPVESTPATISPTLLPHTLPSEFLTLPPPVFSTLPIHKLLPRFPTLASHTIPPDFPTLSALPPHTFPPFPLIPGTQEPSSGGREAAVGVPSVSLGSSGAVAFGAPSVSSVSGRAFPTIDQVAVTSPSVLQPLPIAQPSGSQAQVQYYNPGAPDSLNLPQLISLPDLIELEEQLLYQGGSGPAKTAGRFGPVLPTAEELHQQQQRLQTYQQPQKFDQSQIFEKAAPPQNLLILPTPELGSVTPSPEFVQQQLRQQQAFANYMSNPLLIGRH